MEATHLLLGRPWKFDKHTLHDRHTNKFSFHFHGKKITLAPRSYQEINRDLNKMKEKREKEKEKKKNKGKLPPSVTCP